MQTPVVDHTRVRRYWTVLATLAGCGAVPAIAAAGYVPTTKDMMSIQATLHRYHEGLDQHNPKLMASAFVTDGSMVIIDHGRQLSTVSHDQLAAGNLTGGGSPAAGAPAGTPGGTAATAGRPAAEPANLWHFTDIDSYFEFQSPTHATHYAYWMDVHVHEDSHSSTLGIPGHYEDALVKRHGQWLFLSRKVFVGTK